MATVGPNYVGTATAVSGIWSSLANSQGSGTGTYATWVNNSRRGEGEWEGSNFGLSVPAGAVIDQVSVTVRHLESSTSNIDFVTAQLYVGGTAIDSPTTLVKQTSVREDTFVIGPGVLLDTDIPNLAVRVVSRRVNTTASTTQSIDSARITVTYTAAAGPVEKAGTDSVSIQDAGSRLIEGATRVPPTIVQTVNLAEGGGNRQLPAVTTQAGDYIVVQIIGQDQIGNFTVEAIGLTFTERVWRSDFVLATTAIYTTQDSTGGSRTVFITPADGLQSYRAVATVVRNSDGVGTFGHGPGQERDTTPTDEHSAIFINVADGSGQPVTSLSWHNSGVTVSASVGQISYAFGRVDDAGSVFLQTHGATTPIFGNPNIALIEMLGGWELSSTSKSGSDSSSALDAGTLLASFTGTDAGASLDAPSGPLSVVLTGSDPRATVEAYQLVVTLQAADTGAAGDNPATLDTAAAPSGADTATATDTATLTTSRTGTDGAAATEARTLIVTFTAPDLASLVDLVQSLAATHQAADTAGQVEGFSLQAGGNQLGADGTSIAEGRLLAVQLIGSDTSTHVEGQTVSQGASRSDGETSSTAEGRTLAVQLTAAEIFTAIEAFTLSAGGNSFGTEAWGAAEQAQLSIQVTGVDGASTTESGVITLFRLGTDSSTTADNAALVAQLSQAEIFAAADVLAVLTGPKTWRFLSAEIRTVPVSIGDSESHITVSISASQVSRSVSF